MKLLNEKYNSLKPKIEYISDKAVLAQAWKKTHNYIRQHNWYADPLALDISALGLEKNIESWSAIISDDFYAQSKTYPIELVPAPKSERWNITTGWEPSTTSQERDENPPLRPLAHITVRDQTFATSLMMCVADAVETAQGDCSNTNFFDAQKKHVYSYGNRLLCDWEDKAAWFRWGNAEIYRKFFTDYQNFLQRPLYIGREISNSHSDNDHVFIVKLDLSKFYDKIDRSVLLSKLAKIAKEYYETNDNQFWRVAQNICSWQWDDASVNVAKNIGLKISNTGLPQGLVSAGFFANVYLLDFDKALGSYINRTIPTLPKVTLHDYCRYVDDLRLVISVDGELPELLGNQISDWINKLLTKYAHNELSTNPKKTKVTSLSDLDNAGNLSSKVRNIQDELSGPMDRDSLEGVMGALESLLDLKTDFDIQPDETNNNPLIKLIQIDTDIREDTLKRFAANRLEQVINKKRKLSFEQSDIKDNESELLSRKLIKAWMQDPSLAIVLRKAFEIYPSLEIGEPVFSEVYKLSVPKANDKVTSAIMNYLLADIFRCCIDLNSTSENRDYPESTNLDEFLDLGAQYALKVLNEERPKFLKRQASLLLAVLNRPTLIIDSPEELIQDSLHKILIGKHPRDTFQVYPLYEVAAQITNKPNLIASYLINHISSLDDERRKSILEDFAKRDADGFWLSIWKNLSKDKNKYKSDIELFGWTAPTSSINLKSGKQKLSRVIASERNGFEHEQGLIKLALGLINFSEKHWSFKSDDFLFSPNELTIYCKPLVAKWEEIWKPDFTEIIVDSVGSPKDPRFKIPDWITKSDESCKIYWIGAILRATAIGSNDFTGNRWRSNPKLKSYKGLKTGWYKRRMGMMYSSEALVGEYGTLSNWVCELFMKCLQWPGFQSNFLSIKEIGEISDLLSFKKVLIARLSYLNSHYCESSKMPTAITQIKKNFNDKRGFRIVTVQQILPKTKDFSVADLTLDSPKARAINRDHLSKICNLTYKTICAKLNADLDLKSSGADLIVFPEVAIHYEDQDLIKRLADKTKSIVFAGMVFMDYKGKLVNNGRWFIPDYQAQGRRWIIRDQGKANMTYIEKKFGISPNRPCQHLIEVNGHPDGPFKITGAICYDATDLKLASDLRGKSDLFVVCAHNKDVNTFDTMVSALNYHMYQHVVVVNKGEFGGSTIQAPYKESYERLISHAHGGDQISINIADLDLAAFRRTIKEYKKVKYKPAGM